MRSLIFLPLSLACLLALTACQHDPPRALGTLEWDRVTLPSPAAEKIIAIEVREGQRVHANDPLLRLEPDRTRAQFEAAQAQVHHDTAALQELRNGPRQEDIAQAQATVAAAQATASDTQTYYQRLQKLLAQHLIATSDVDHARAAADSATAQLHAAQQALLELQRGTRIEQIRQGEAAAAQASAEAANQQVTLEKLTLSAPLEAVVDSIPYKLGDQAPVGAPLVVLLAGPAPYARVYVPEPLRAGVKVGDAARIHIDGSDRVWAGKVRMIRSDPTFTPYYALTGQDATRLSYLAEVQLGPEAHELHAGVPLWVEFGP